MPLFAVKAHDILVDQIQVIKYQYPSTLAVHFGTLCKTNMAATSVRTLCKVGWNILESQTARRPAIFSYPVGNVSALMSRRAYGTGGAGVRAKLVSSLRGGRSRLLGCAFLLGGGMGLYQTVKFSVQQHLAEEKSTVSVRAAVSVWVLARHVVDGVPLISDGSSHISAVRVT